MTHNRPYIHILITILFWVLLSSGCQSRLEPEPSGPQASGTAPTTAPGVTVAAPQPTPTGTALKTPVTTVPETAQEEVAGDALSEGQVLDEAGIALDLASSLIESVTVETVPAFEQVPDPGPRYLAQPAHTILHLAGFPQSANYRQPQIAVYPLEAYRRLTLDAKREVEQLQTLLASGSGVPPGVDDLPYLPAPNAIQIVQAKVQQLDFQNGTGVRYLTQYVQDVSPVVSNSLFYTFQGMTVDGQFWISAVLPVASDTLPADIPTAQEQGFDSFAYNFDPIGYERYLAEQKVLIDGLTDDAFTPQLATLDALVQSLELSAYQGPDVDMWAPDVAPGPDQVLDTFLEAYLLAGGFPAGAQRDNPYLHLEFAAQVEDTIAAYRHDGIETIGYDPILMSQLAPAQVGTAGHGFERMSIGSASFEGQSATVTIERHWHYTGAVSPLRFSFSWNGERWLISGVNSTAGLMPAMPEDGPVAVTEQLMAMMTASAGQFPTVDAWLNEVKPDMVLPNATLALCAPSWPAGFAIEGTFTQPAPLTLSSNVEEEAYVVIYLPFDGGLQTAHLVRQGDVWQVSEVICGDTPQGKALALYAWYLGAARDAGETRWAERMPNIDAMNPGQYFVTERFLREAQARFQEDAYLPPARVPDRFVVRPGAQEDIVLVDLEYLSATEATIKTLQLTLVRVGGVWLVDDVMAIVEE